MAPLAQNLPHIVIELISRYSAVYDADKYNPMQKLSCSGLRLVLPLAGICHSWRYAILADLYQDVTWCQTGCPRCLKCSCCRRSMPRVLESALGLDLGDHIKSLNIHIQSAGIFDGKALAQFGAVVSDDMILSSVKRLTLSLSIVSSSPTPAQKICYNNIGVFCNQLDRLLPNARSLELVSMDPRWPLPNHQPFAFLFNRLSSKVSGVSAELMSCNGISIAATGPAPLKSISIYNTNGTTSVGELIQRHSETLENISLTSWTIEPFRSMALKESGDVVIYPRVRVLKIFARYFTSTDTINTGACAGITLFPILEKFVCNGEYPYSDAIAFRGNERTLREISMCIDENLVRVLESSGMHIVGRYPALDYVDFLDDYYFPEGLLSRYIQIVLALGRKASVLRFNPRHTARFGDLQFTLGDLSQNMRILNLGSVKFTVPQAVGVLISLPQLHQLSISLERNAELCHTDSLHSYCVGKCDEVDSDIDEDEGASDDLLHDTRKLVIETENSHVDFLQSHMGLICADLGSLAELQTQFPSISPKLVNLRFERVEYFNLIELCRAAVVFTQLCPSIRHVEFFSMQLHRHCTVMPDDIPNFEYQ